MNVSLPRAVASGLAAVARAFNDAAAALEAGLARVAVPVYVDVDAPAAANTPFLVPHRLGQKPTMFVAQSEASAACYATPADLQEWNAEIIKIRCSAANVRLRVKVEVV